MVERSESHRNPAAPRDPPRMGRGAYAVSRHSLGVDRRSQGVNRSSQGVDHGSEGVDGDSPGAGRGSRRVNRDPQGVDRDLQDVDRDYQPLNRHSEGVNRDLPLRPQSKRGTIRVAHAGFRFHAPTALRSGRRALLLAGGRKCADTPACETEFRSQGRSQTEFGNEGSTEPGGFTTRTTAWFGPQ